ncbi:TPR repeat protein 29 [Intoshia linei]|uniref:Tetratricopeptide repeat protein 29 n=1 Tax=Intoshia linei TaxID=1819745 RepID=A0A177B7U5_9BILA|nr:TPR repeat protein 29 [Intoshia linei]
MSSTKSHSNYLIANSKGTDVGRSESALERVYLKCSYNNNDRCIFSNVVSNPSQSHLLHNLPVMSLIETREYRRDFYENELIRTLCTGHHESYSEIFNLIYLEEKYKINENPNDKTVLLKNDHEKFKKLVRGLTTLEDAKLENNTEKQYDEMQKLANHFREIGDKFLAHHFFEKCLECALSVVKPESKLVAMSYCNLALSFENNGEFAEAIKHMVAFYTTSDKEKSWMNDDNSLFLYQVASNHLSRLYSQVSDDAKKNKNETNHLINARLSYSSAMTSEIGDTIARSSYKLGIALKNNNEIEEALIILEKYMMLCVTYENQRGAGQACLSIAQCYIIIKNYESSIEFLEKYLKVAESTGFDDMICNACSHLGSLYNMLAQYDKAVEYFNKSYSIARSIDDNKTIGDSCVLFGIALGYKTLNKLSLNISRSVSDKESIQHVEANERCTYSAFSNIKSALKNILNWKDIRLNIPKSE